MAHLYAGVSGHLSRRLEGRKIVEMWRAQPGSVTRIPNIQMPNIRALYQFVPMQSACPEAGCGAACPTVFPSVATVAGGGAAGFDLVRNVGGGLAVAAGLNVPANQLLRALLARSPFGEFAKDVRAKARRALWLAPFCSTLVRTQTKTDQLHCANWPAKLGIGCGGRI